MTGGNGAQLLKHKKAKARAGEPVTARESDHSVSTTTPSQLQGAIVDLKGFNTQLKDELSELKDYLAQTNKRLEQLEAEDALSTGRSSRTGSTAYTSRSRMTTARTGKSSRLSTARSDVSSVLSDARSAIARSRASSRAA